MENTQLSLFGKTYPEHSAAIEARTSAVSSKNLRKSPEKKFQYLNLQRGNGILPERSWETEFPSHGASSMRNTGECPSAARESTLWQILQMDAPDTYYLSAKACQGILNRAKRRGKQLPAILEAALIEAVNLAGGYAQSVNCLNPWDAQSIRQYSPDGIFSSLNAGTGGGQNRAGVCYALQGNGIDRKIENGCNGKGFRENEMYTLDVVDRHAVVYEPKSAMDENWHESEVKNAIRANASESSHAIVYDARGNGNGKTVPTLTGDHQNRVTDYTSVLVTTNKPPPQVHRAPVDPAGMLPLAGFPGWLGRHSEKGRI